jgi:uncharacterized protein
MRIYRGKIRPIAEDILNELIAGNDIEVGEDERAEVVLDVEAIIKEYLRMEEEISGQARELLQKRGASYTEFGKIKRMLAEEKDFEMGDKALAWIANQIIECFLINSRVTEVYTDDYQLRKKIIQIFSRHLGMEEQVDKEVRDRIKHLTENSPEWEIEYQKLYKQIARRKGLL